ncbi:Uncharacterised protein [uncultured archaeon]|nr:Uncharacterised protein [uncultured archaeon]
MDLKGVWTGIKASIIASSCCSLPLALAMTFSTLGVGSLAAALRIARYKIAFEALGTLFLAASLYFTIKRESGGKCTLADIGRRKTLVAVSIITYVAMTLILIYLILPTISRWMFGV